MAQNVKTVQGLEIASVKSVQGLAIASAKTILGVDNTGGGTGEFVTSSPSGGTRNDFDGWVGFRFTVGASDINVTHVGLWVVSGNTATRSVQIRKISDDTLAAGANVNRTGQSGYTYVAASGTLLAGQGYYMQAEFSIADGDVWYTEAVYSTTAVATVDFATFGTQTTHTDAGAGKIFVPVNFKYS